MSAWRTVSGIDEAAVVVGVDGQERRGRARRRERGAVVSAPRHLTVAARAPAAARRAESAGARRRSASATPSSQSGPSA